MSTTGIQIFNEAGGVSYTTSDITWNQVDFVYLPAGSSFSMNYPALDGREGLMVQMTINPPPVNQRAYVNAVSISGTLVSASGSSVDTYILVLMR